MKISHFLGFERLRDGGSLIAAFQSFDSCEYWLMFPIQPSDRCSFADAVLVNRTTGIQVRLTRASAGLWLQRLRPFFEARLDLPLVSRAQEMAILNTMLALCGPKDE